jgi:hypothetical protein
LTIGSGAVRFPDDHRMGCPDDSYGSNMEPLHSIEYVLTSELATDVQSALVRWDFRRGWRRDVPFLLCALTFATLIVWLGLSGWVLPIVGGGLLFVLTLFVIGAIFRRWGGARSASLIAVLALGASDRRVRIEFAEERVRLETEFFRGEAAWTELEEAVIFPTFWLLRFSNGGQIVLPSASVSPALESFIRAQSQGIPAPIHQA